MLEIENGITKVVSNMIKKCPIKGCDEEVYLYDDNPQYTHDANWGVYCPTHRYVGAVDVYITTKRDSFVMDLSLVEEED